MADFINDYRGSDRLVRIFLDQSLVIDVNIKFDLNHHCKFPEKINCNCEYCDSEIGRPALWLACFNGHLNVVRTLIEIGKADVNLSDHKNWTPLRIAILKKHIDIVKYLIEQANAIIDENRDLFVAIQIGSYDIVDYLLNKGCDPNTRLIDQDSSYLQVDYTFFALHYAINHCFEDLSFFLSKVIFKNFRPYFWRQLSLVCIYVNVFY